jgi:Xaa-Pro dipeptidase
MLDIPGIQNTLAAAQIDGWLFADFRGSDELAYQVLGLPRDLHATRRWYYFIPSQGTPSKLVHTIESKNLDTLPGVAQTYVSWHDLERSLQGMLVGKRTLAMQYSPRNANPYVSRVDAGTVDLVRSWGHEIVSSGDLISTFQAVLSPSQYDSHREAAQAIDQVIDATFEEIARRLCEGSPCTEYLIQQFVVEQYHRHGLVSDYPPIVAVQPNNANPHYMPTASRFSVIKPHDLVLLDTWAKRGDDGIYYDVTWMGYCGSAIPARIQEVFSLVCCARDAAYDYIIKNHRNGIAPRGCDVDDIARGVIENAGYGKSIRHRTGHSIHTSTHGSGAHLDNLETRDERRLIQGLLFSIEPSVYLDAEFGIRSEINVYIDQTGPVATGRPRQIEIVRIGE